MIINLSPIRMDVDLSVSVVGDVLSIYVSGEEQESLDFSLLPVGGMLPADAVVSEWLIGPVSRDVDGHVRLILKLPHGRDASPSARFPSPILVSQDGPVELPK